MNKKALLEAALFLSNKPLSTKDLEKLGIKREELNELIPLLKKELESEDRGIFLAETLQGFQLRVKPEYISKVRHLTPYQDLRMGLLRVLALVAYKQPITQSDIVKVIGNRTYEYIRELESRGLIRSVKQGRTKALIPTKEFADYFGLERPEDVKKIFDKVKPEGAEKSKGITD